MCKPKYLQNALKLVSAAELHVRQKLSLSEVAEYQRDVSAGIMGFFFFQSYLEIQYLMEKYELNLS